MGKLWKTSCGNGRKLLKTVLTGKQKQEKGAKQSKRTGKVIHLSVENYGKMRDYLPFTVLIISLICKEKAELVSTSCSIFLMEW